MTSLPALALLLALSGATQARVVDRVAAIVNRDVITLSEIYELGSDFIEERAEGEGPDGPLRRQAEIEVLDTLIQRALIAQEVERLELDVTREEIEKTIDDIARQNGMERDQLQLELSKAGLDWSTYRQEVQENLRQMKFAQVVLRPRIQISDDEIQDLYNRRVRTIAADNGRRQVQGIFLPWPNPDTPDSRAELAKRAQTITDRAATTPWAALVAEFPESPYASAGGAMGAYARGEMVAELDKIVFNTPVGTTTAPVALSGGLIVVRIASEDPGDVPSLDIVKADLEAELAEQKMAREMELWYTQARRRATVDIKLETP